MIRLLGKLITLCLILSGCANPVEQQKTIHIGVAAPQHYEVWVEQFELEVSGDKHWRMAPGSVSCCWKGSNGSSGKGGPSTLIPEHVGIEWYSFAESKTYYILFSMPENLEKLMQEKAPYSTSKGRFNQPRDILTVGVAPGGTVVVWIQNQTGNEIEVGRYKAQELKGVNPGFSEWQDAYHRENESFLKEHGVPTTGW